MPFLQYFYVFLWAALAVLCFFIGRKIGLAGYLLTLFFVFMTIWYGLEAFAGLPVFDGVMGHVFRGVLLVFLIIIVFIWYRGRRAQIMSQNKTVPHAEDCHCEHCEDERDKD
ncbi:hypothetical protein [Ruminococcus sp.]|uniref:hypothetical protein n=1 Tax=Ruminococcus sp. TaxID=41978 RepID=UPI002E7A6F6E|nr:hypothetical protein [Ruminococcus sp.]MEE1262683.1 hypothetical protein [Ruminococcus sp.]